ncbi:rubber oxygenase-like isoform X2 [Adelges cooleyi]|uniref:rubber oxygenase-like isoform X2 n=1 Tax=Adelges cooleyi TaxID=133065 RepID=UPI00217F5328|nr:rubber oxygenase-like isoform X2 [Adelges cooleyi]
MECTVNVMTSPDETETAKQRVRTILEEGCNVPVERKRPRDLPEWFDEQLFVRAQKHFFANFYSMFVGKLIGLILVLTVPTILDVLVLTNKSSDSYSAFRRYLDTIRHMVRWYGYDVGDLKSKSQKSVNTVHSFHCTASRLSEKTGLGVRVSQKDMALTQFGFMGLMVLRKKELAIVGSEEDEFAIVHFWRTIGYMLGIQDKYNLCQGTLEEVRGVCAVVLDDVYAPGLKQPPKGFQRMLESLLDGLKPVSPVLDVHAFMRYTKDLCGVSKGVDEPPLRTWFSRCMYNIQVFTHEVLLAKRWLAWVFRPLLNYNMRFSVWVNVKFPFGAAIKYGTKVFVRVQPERPATYS